MYNMAPEDRIRLAHMIEAAESAGRFIQNRTRDDLDADLLLVFGLVRAVEIVGEAASRVSPQTREAFPQIPWTRIIGMRNRLVHAYFDVDAEILWNTVAEALPELVEQLREIAAMK